MFPSNYFADRYFPARYFNKLGAAAAPLTIIKRPVAAATVTELAIDFTRPVYLVKMLFPDQTRYLSTGEQLIFNSDTYIEGQLSVASFNWNSDGGQTGRLILSNENNSASSLILNNTTNDVLVEIYITYLISGGGNTDPEYYAVGSMDGAKLNAKEAIIEVVGTTTKSSFVPLRYHTEREGFNWLPSNGDLINWGDEVFVLQEEG